MTASSKLSRLEAKQRQQIYESQGIHRLQLVHRSNVLRDELVKFEDGIPSRVFLWKGMAFENSHTKFTRLDDGVSIRTIIAYQVPCSDISNIVIPGGITNG